MKRRIFLIHGWGGSPNNDWFPWARETLKERFEVYVPAMPETEHPKIIPWVEKLDKVVGEIRESDIFVGHSIGCQTILRYLDRLPEGKRADQVILVAPWWYLTLGDGEEQADADPWFVQDVDFKRIGKKARKFVCVFSDNDPYVPIEKNKSFFKSNLHPEIIVKARQGHFNDEYGVKNIEWLLGLINQNE